MDSLESIVKRHIEHDGPFDRMKAGSSKPVFAINSPLFDQKAIFNDDAWKGLVGLIEHTDDIRPDDINPTQLIILGGLISDWRFRQSKTEGSRLQQTDYTNTDLNQEELADLKERLGRVQDKISMLPKSVVPYYFYGEKDNLNIREIYSDLIDMYAYKVMQIYNGMKPIPGRISLLINKLSEHHRNYESRNSQISKRFDQLTDDRRRKHEGLMQGYETDRIEQVGELQLHKKEEAKLLDEIRNEGSLVDAYEVWLKVSKYEKRFSGFAKALEKLGSRQKDLEKTKAEINKGIGRYEGEIARYKTSIKKQSAELARAKKSGNEKIEKRLASAIKGYQSQLDKSSRTSQNLADKLQTYEDKIADINQRYESIELNYEALQDSVSSRKELVRTHAKRINVLRKETERLEDLVSRTQAKIDIAENNSREEAKSIDSDLQSYDKSAKAKLCGSESHYAGKVKQHSAELARYLKGALSILDRNASYLMTNFNVPTMAHFKGRYDEIGDLLKKIISDAKSFKDMAKTDISSFSHETAERALRQGQDEFQKQYERHMQDFSISEMFSRVTTRKIPLKLREELVAFAHDRYHGLILETITCDGTRKAVVRKGYSGEFEFLGPGNEVYHARASGYGERMSRADQIRSMRNSLLARLERTVGRDNMVHDKFFADPFSNYNDPEMIMEERYAKEKIDLVFGGYSENFIVANVTGANSPHTATLCALGPFYDTKMLSNVESRDTRTPEQKRGRATSGALMLDIGEGIVQATAFTLSHLANMKSWNYKTIAGYHDGDEHVGAGNSNIEAFLGLEEIKKLDSRKQFRIHTGDSTDSEMSSRPDRRNQYEAALKSIVNQFSAYWAWQFESMEQLIERSSLQTPIFHSRGQHDSDFGAVSPIEAAINSLKISQMEPEQRYLMISHLKGREHGWNSPLDEKSIELLSYANQGFGIARLKTKEDPENPFYDILVTHNALTYHKKAKKYDPIGTINFLKRKQDLVSKHIGLICAGDHHSQIYAMSDGCYLSMCSSFKGNSRIPDEPMKQVDQHGLTWEYWTPPGVNRLLVPMRNGYPVSAMLLTEPLMMKAYQEIVAPEIDSQSAVISVAEKRHRALRGG